MAAMPVGTVKTATATAAWLPAPSASQDSVFDEPLKTNVACDRLAAAPYSK